MNLAPTLAPKTLSTERGGGFGLSLFRSACRPSVFWPPRTRPPAKACLRDNDRRLLPLLLRLRPWCRCGALAVTRQLFRARGLSHRKRVPRPSAFAQSPYPTCALPPLGVSLRPSVPGCSPRRRPTRPAATASYPVPVRQAAASLHTSSGPRLAATPLRFTSLHHHQVGRGLSPHELLNMPARCRAAPNGAKKMMNSKTCQPGLRGQRNSDVENRSGPAPFKPYCAQGLRGRKIDKAKVRGFPSGCGLYFSNAGPTRIGRIYGCNRIIAHSSFLSTALRRVAQHRVLKSGTNPSERPIGPRDFLNDLSVNW